MPKIKITILILLTILLATMPRISHSKNGFKVFNVDKTEFPLVKLHYFMHKDGNELLSSQYSIDNFDLRENGKSMKLNEDLTENLRLVCGNYDGYYPLQIAFLVDITESMDDPIESSSFKTRFEITKELLGEFIDSLRFDDGTKSCIVPFTANVKNSDKIKWVDNKIDFNKQVEALELRAGARTDHNAPFGVDGKNGFDIFGHFNKLPNEYRRIIVFITDGEHSSDHGVEFLADTVSVYSNYNDIEVNTMVISDKDYDGLKSVSQNTGGDYYKITRVDDFREDMEDIYAKSQGKSLEKCWLEYESDITCVDNALRNIEVEVDEIFKFSNLTDTTSFIAPESISVNLIPEPLSYTYYFSENNNGNSKHTIKLKALNADIDVSDVVITPNTGEFTVSQTSFSIKEGKTKDIEITFTDDGDGISQEYSLEFVSDCDFEDFTLIATCGGEFDDLVDFGNVPFNDTPQKVVTFTNTAAGEINGNVSLDGAGKAKYTILNGDGAFLLASGETHSVTVEFNADTDGDYEAYIDFSINTECGEAITNLSASTKKGEFAISNLAWNKKRVLSESIEPYDIVNSSGNDLTINKVELKNNGDGSFILDLKGTTLPITLAASEKLDFEIKFIPQTENTFNSSIEVETVEFGLKTGTLEGEGTIPQLRTEDLIFPGTKVNNQSSVQNFIIYNDSDSEVLLIEEVKLDDTDPNFVDFEWESGTQLTNLKVPTNSSILLPAIFHPKTEEANKELPVIISHNGIGNDPSIYSQNSTSKFIGSSPGTDAIIINNIDLGNVFICGEFQKVFSYNNNSDEDMNIQFSNLTDGFSIVPNVISVNKNSSATFAAHYKPETSGSSSITVNMSSNNGRSGSFELSGSGEVAKVKTEFEALEENNFYTPGDIYDSKLKLEIEPIKGLDIKKLNAYYQYNSRQLSPKNIDNLGYDYENRNNGVIITFEDDFEANKEYTFELDFDTYLFNLKNSALTLNLLSEGNTDLNNETCIEHTESNISIPVLSCVNELTAIGLAEPTGMEVNNNFVSNDFEITFFTGLVNENVKIDVLSTSGEVVVDVIDNVLEVGNYKTTLKIDDLHSGIYFLRMQHGWFYKIEKILIMK